MRKYFRIFTFIIAFLPILQCTRNLTSIEYFSVSGKVALQGAPTNSGVTVALYEPAELDTTIMNLRKRFPSVGFDLSQATEFDHREAEPVYTTTTDASGQFQINDIPEGTYNLVAEKKDYGWRYIYDISAHTDSLNIPLYPVIKVAGTLDGYTEWPAHQHIIVTNDVTVPEGGTLLIGEGVVVRVERDNGIFLYGNLQIYGNPDDYIKFTNYYEQAENGWKGIEIKNDNENTMQYCVLEDMTEGITVKSSNIIIKNILLTGLEEDALLLFNRSSALITHSSFICNTNAIRVEGGSELKLNYSIVYMDELVGKGIICNSSKLKLSNNLLSGYNSGLLIEYEATSEISKNYFIENGICISFFTNKKNQKSIIKQNTFNTADSTLFLILHHADPIINNNNLIQSRGMYLIAHQYQGDNYSDIDARFNYWNDDDITNVENKIFDTRLDYFGDKGNWKILIMPMLDDFIESALPSH